MKRWKDDFRTLRECPVFALLASAYLMTGCVYRLYADPPLLNCQITTPAQCDSFIRVQCAETDPGYDVEWVEQFDNDNVSIGWKPTLKVRPCDTVAETVEIDTKDETQCGGSIAGGTHIPEANESHKVCWVRRWCLTTPAEQGGPAAVTLSWRTAPDGGGSEIDGRSESLQPHLCQPVIVDAKTILATDDEIRLDWFKCVPYSNCVQED